MRLFGKVDGQIDRRDRAAWLTIPFDLGRAALPRPCVAAALAVVPGAGSAAVFVATAAAGEVNC